jgi:hypothetical protein
LLSGELPAWLGKLPSLAVLSLRNNSLQGTLPESVRDMGSLRSLTLACNNLSGAVPDMSALTNLQVVDLANNSLGPAFPRLGRKVASVVLSGNRFGNGLPAEEVASFYLLERLDVSRNRFVGPFPPALLSLPSIEYLSVAGNRLTGLLAANMSCGENLRFVDVSSNLLTGTLPSCLAARAAAAASKVTLLAASNCLSGTPAAGTQHPALFCQNQALAVGIVPVQSRGGGGKGKSKAVVVGGSIAAAFAAAALVGVAAFVAARKAAVRRAKARPPRRLVEHAAASSMSMSVSGAYPSQLLADARYISQTVKLQGALGIPAYRSFSLVELEAATNNFEVSRLMGQDAHGQMYRGTLSNGTDVTIRSLRVAARRGGGQGQAAFNRHVEMISRLRHRHLVSALGHCFEYNLDDATVTQLFLVFEYVHNGNLRSRISRECHYCISHHRPWPSSSSSRPSLMTRARLADACSSLIQRGPKGGSCRGCRGSRRRSAWPRASSSCTGESCRGSSPTTSRSQTSCWTRTSSPRSAATTSQSSPRPPNQRYAMQCHCL